MNFKHRIVPILACGALLAGWTTPIATAAAQGVPPTTPPAAGVVADAQGAPATPAASDVPPAPATAATPATPESSATTAAPTAAPAADAASAPADAAQSPDAPPEALKSMDQEVQSLKKDVIDLNKDLFVLEEELLFPANTQVALYISMDVGVFFALDSVTVKIDNKEVKNYLYTAREADALLKGGVQQIYLGNLKVGKHELVAFFTGKGPTERDYKRGATISFDKGVGAKYLELKITDRVPKHQPEFMIKDWE
jgi:hypothetical protein